MVLHFVLLVFAFVILVCRALGAAPTRINLLETGLAFWVAAELVLAWR